MAVASWWKRCWGNAYVRTSDRKRSTAPDQPPDRRRGGRQRGWKAGFLIVFRYQVDACHSLSLQVVDCVEDGGNGQEHSIADMLENMLCWCLEE